MLSYLAHFITLSVIARNDVAKQQENIKLSLNLTF